MYEKGKAKRSPGPPQRQEKQNRACSKTDALTKADVFKDMDDSLKALQTDHVDIWHLHSGTRRMRSRTKRLKPAKC